MTDDSDTPQYRLLLRQAFANLPITQEELAKRSGVARTSMQGIIYGELVGSTTTVARIAHVLTGGQDPYQAILDAHAQFRTDIRAPKSRWENEPLPGLGGTSMETAVRELTEAVRELTKIMRERQ